MKVVFDCQDGDVQFERIGSSLWVSTYCKGGDGGTDIVEETREIPYDDVVRGIRAFEMEDDA